MGFYYTMTHADSNFRLLAASYKLALFLFHPHIKKTVPANFTAVLRPLNKWRYSNSEIRSVCHSHIHEQTKGQEGNGTKGLNLCH